MIGFSSSFPVEVLFAAGIRPIDLNNVFVTNDSAGWVSRAEQEGFPRNVCAWIKGMYALTREAFHHGVTHQGRQVRLEGVVGITGGDCSNTHALLSAFRDEGIPVIPFSFPYERDRDLLDAEIRKLENLFGVTREQTQAMKGRLDAIRRTLVELDDLTWKTGQVTGGENHLWLVNASDFETDPDGYEAALGDFLTRAVARPITKPALPLAVVGVPPILTDLHERIAGLGASVVFNEVQRQFAMPTFTDDIVDQYLAYTYPYSIFERLADIGPELKRRGVVGVIAYSQAFCHRQIDHILLRKYIDLPLLLLEGDQPGPLDERTLLRLESFLEMIGG